jgi:hypothetical protein
MTSRPFTAAPILAVMAVVLVTMAAYVGGYLQRGDYLSASYSGKRLRWVARKYPSEWERDAFIPAGWLEAKLLCRDVCLKWEGDPAYPPTAGIHFFSPFRN